MSTFRTPVGPQSPKVYWRRRLILGVGALAVIVIIVLIIGRLGSGSPNPAATTKSGVSPSVSPSAAPPASAPATAAACVPARIRLLAVANKSTYAATEQPQVSMSITNSGSADCTINLGSTQQEYIITSGSETIWDSKDCQTAPVDAPVTLKPGVALPVPTTALAWDRTRSSKTTCDASRPPVTAGGASYHLGVKVGALSSKSTVQFLLN